LAASTCGRNTSRIRPRNAPDAATETVIVRLSGENSRLSQRDPSTAPTQLIALGQTIGITDPSFASEIQEGRYLPWPSFVTEYAFARGIGGTPSVFVQGIPVPARPDL